MAVDGPCVSFMASLTISRVSVVVWVALGVVSHSSHCQLLLGWQRKKWWVLSHLDREEGHVCALYVVVVVDKLKITKRQLVFEKSKKRTIKHLSYMQRGLTLLPAT
jgi:hypothetical protein